MGKGTMYFWAPLKYQRLLIMFITGGIEVCGISLWLGLDEANKQHPNQHGLVSTNENGDETYNVA
jgi:hypothetical protein